jgi:hypothetical protein
MFWRLLPNKSYVFPDESKNGIKKLNDRVTILLISNATGTEKDICMIGKSQKPRCFRNVKKLPIRYYGNKNAWMTSDVFRKELSLLNQKMKIRGRKILLFADNFSAHYTDLDLSHVKIAFFPANTTSVLQPLDLGIIRSFKAAYRRLMLQHLLLGLEESETFDPKKIQLIDEYICFTLHGYRLVLFVLRIASEKLRF